MTALVVGVSSSLIVYNNYNKINSNYSGNNKEEIDKFIEAYNNILDSYVEKVDGSDLIDEAIKAIIKQKYKIICLNDSNNIKNFEDKKQKINDAFNKILPDKSSFEI